MTQNERKARQSFIDEDRVTTITSEEQFLEIINRAEEAGSPEYHRLTNLDLSGIDAASQRSNFDGWHIENVIFSRFEPHRKERKEIFGLSFMGATLKGVCFAQAHLYRCNFDTMDKEAYKVYLEQLPESKRNTEKGHSEAQTSLSEVTFFLSDLELCRFRNTKIHAADFRYSHVRDCTIREAMVTYGDFYFCSFKGCTTFDKSKFFECSFTNCLFENNAIRISNIPNGIIQEHYKEYCHMVLHYPSWYHYNPSASFSSINHEANRNNVPASRMSNKQEAASFYKNMSGIYAGKGLNRDSNRAYKMAKINEIKYLHLAIPSLWKKGEYSSSLRYVSRLLLDYTTVAMGFGYMWWVVVFWFIILIMIYGLYYYFHSVDEIDVAISYSFNNSLGPNSSEITKIVNSFLASCQSAFGMLLIGFLGFIMANNLRNDS